MLNPWIILAVVLAIVGAGGGGFASGHHFGTATGISVAVLTQTTSDAMASEGESLGPTPMRRTHPCRPSATASHVLRKMGL